MSANHIDIVKAVHALYPPKLTVEGALDFIVTLLQSLPKGEGAGLLLKPSGENITTFKGNMVSASRICYPNGAIVKVLTDVPSTNGPSWQDDGELVETSRYLSLDTPTSGGGSSTYEGNGGDQVWDAFGNTIFADYAAFSQAPNPSMFRWAGRTIWDAIKGGLTVQQSIDKHRNEWLSILRGS